MMTSILHWLERELLDKGIEYEADKIEDGPSSPTSFLRQLPLREWGFKHCPAIPFWANAYGDADLTHVLATVGKLKVRADEAIATAYHGLSRDYTIAEETHPAYEFLYGAPYPGSAPAARAGSGAPNELALQEASQFTISWTTYQDVYKDSQDLAPHFTETLTDHDTATDRFWPTIATFGLPYNLLVLAKVDAKRAATLKEEVGAAWAAEKMDALLADGLLYEVDMSILASLGPSTAVDGTVRFTPGTVTVLKQGKDKALTPIAITLSTTDGRPPRVYTRKDEAWLYALQAAKTSVTVWGIWLGHVYHWHIVTAAMQMTMYNHLPAGHRLYPLLQPQSQSLIDFDFVLLTHLWGQIAPPTPVAGYMPLLELLDTFARDRTFFDPVVGYLLDIWDITGDFVTAVVHDLYSSDDEVAQDDGLKKWMTASRDPHEGNVRGVPKTIETRAELAKVLTSILYRVTVHGAGSLNPAVNPALSFVSNFPPCLQSAQIHEPGHAVSTEELLDLLPHTGTIGGMTTFYFTFVYSQPYAQLIPSGNIKSDPYFPEKSCNEALFAYRAGISAFVDKYVIAWNEALEQLRGGAPESPPSYGENQYGQWPRSIEI